MMRYPDAVWLPGPVQKQGYAAYPSPQAKEGFVLHSMVGGLSAALQRLDGPDTASWHFSIGQDGTVYQHYDPLTVCWHCGLPGDADSLTAAVGNVALIGIEHEGGAYPNFGEPLTEPQYQATVRLQQWCYASIPTLKPPALRASHWEHRWLSATACPSWRIPWERLLKDLEVRGMKVYERSDGGWVVQAAPLPIFDATGKVRQGLIEMGFDFQRATNDEFATAISEGFKMMMEWALGDMVRGIVREELKGVAALNAGEVEAAVSRALKASKPRLDV